MTEIAEKNQQMDVEILIRIAQIASSKLEVREVLDSIAHVVAESFKKDLCSICLLKPEQKVICIESIEGSADKSVNVFCVKDDKEIFDSIFKDLQPVIVNDMNEDHLIRPILNPDTSHFRSLLAVPIIRYDILIGILMVQNKEPYEFSREEINLLTIIAHNISAAVGNAELYRNVKSQLDELKIVHEIGKAITSILNIDELLPYICEQVSKVYNVTGCILRTLLNMICSRLRHLTDCLIPLTRICP